MHYVALLHLAARGTGFHPTKGWFIFLIGFIIGFIACFAIEHRR